MRAVRIAPRAIEALHSQSRWEILSSHTHAINLVSPSGKLLSVTQGRIRMGPFSIEVDRPPGGCHFDGLAATGTFRRDRCISIGDTIVDLAYVTSWDPTPRWPALRATAWQPQFIPLIVATLRDRAPEGSLARVIDQLQTPDANHKLEKRPALQGLLQSSAAAAAIRLSRALGANDLQAAISASATLVGVGPGLTPSGDDFLIGMIFGIHSALPETAARALTDKIDQAGAGRTNLISTAWLSAAADGQAVQAWHDLVGAILSRDGVGVDRACQSLLDLGHTSGADALAGFAAFHLTR